MYIPMMLMLLVSGVPEFPMHQSDTLVSLLCSFALEVSVGGSHKIMLLNIHPVI